MPPLVAACAPRRCLLSCCSSGFDIPFHGLGLFVKLSIAKTRRIHPVPEVAGRSSLVVSGFGRLIETQPPAEREGGWLSLFCLAGSMIHGRAWEKAAIFAISGGAHVRS